MTDHFRAAGATVLFQNIRNLKINLPCCIQAFLPQTPLNYGSSNVLFKVQLENSLLQVVIIYSRRQKRVPVPYSFYDRKMLCSVKHYDPITGANRNYGSPIYSVIARFVRVNNARAWGSLRGFEILLAFQAYSFCKQIDDERQSCVKEKTIRYHKKTNRTLENKPKNC